MSSHEGNASLDPGFFDGRLLLEMERWECTYHLGLSPEQTPPKYRFQGGLFFSQGFEIEARVIAPVDLKGRSFRIWLSPFGPDMKFGPKQMDEVGRIYLRPQAGISAGSSITLFFPESTISTLATCLATLWKYLHIWTFDEDADEASISGFTFTRDVHENLLPWVAGERT